jgi:hypothetical protein
MRLIIYRVANADDPTGPLGGYHVLPISTWVDPPSTGDLRRWGALLTTG